MKLSLILLKSSCFRRVPREPLRDILVKLLEGLATQLVLDVLEELLWEHLELPEPHEVVVSDLEVGEDLNEDLCLETVWGGEDLVADGRGERVVDAGHRGLTLQARLHPLEGLNNVDIFLIRIQTSLHSNKKRWKMINRWETILSM